MALPTVLVNSASGSDSAASGAGPGTAITGSTGRTRNTASQLKFGLFGATDDLSGVATDGSAVLYMAISTAGQRNFSAVSATKNTRHTTTGDITSGAAVLSALASTTGWSVGDVVKVAGAGAASADLYSTILTVDSGTQVTLNDNAGTTVVGAAVENPKQFTLATSQGVNTGTTDTSWAVGGKRASIGSTTSRKLVENNGTTGDALAGWVVECESGHTEALTAALNIRVTGNTTDGMFTFRGASGTRPVLSFNINSGCIILRNAKILIHGFELKNTNATKTTSAGVEMLGSAQIVRDMKIDDATDKFANGVTIRDSGGLVDRCRVGNCAGVGIVGTITSFLRSRIIGCTVFACGSHGVALNGDFVALTLAYNLLYGNAGDGINIDADAGDIGRQWTILGNTIDGNTGDGIEIANDLATPTLIINNLLTNNGGYGLKLSHASATATYVAGSPIQIYNNNTYGNTSQAYLPTGAGSDDPGIDPSYVNAAAGNFTVTNESLKATGYPTAIGSVPNYVTPGALQVQSPSPAEIAEAVWEYPDRQLTA